MNRIQNLSRRDFLVTSTAATGGLLLGFKMNVGEGGLAAYADTLEEVAINTWLSIAPDNSITIQLAKSEMGQGVFTAMPMILADELEADWDMVTVKVAPTAPEHLNPEPGMRGRGTGGSASIRTGFDKLTKAGATAREMLVEAAANRWGVPVSECVAEASLITHAPSGKTLTYGDVANDASKLTPPENPVMKEAKNRRLVGSRLKRLDTPMKVDGSAVFGMDVVVDDMLVGVYTQAPQFGGRLVSVDPAPALAMPGVHHVIELENAVAVVGDGYWQALKGAEALVPEWATDRPDISTTAIGADYTAALSGDAVDVTTEGDVAAAMAKAAKTVEAIYEVPFLAHATMEPMNATAHVTDDHVEIWAPTQGPNGIQYRVAGMLNMKPEQVNVNTTFLGGGFGRRSEVDFVIPAVEVSKQIGRPVKLIWSREEDMRHDFYRPAVVARFRAGLDEDGLPVAWDNRVVTSSILQRLYPPAVASGVDGASVEGLKEIPYHVENMHMDFVLKEPGVPVGFWRSVGHSYSGFLAEGFVDELAVAGGHDPAEFRRTLLKDEPRHLAVLDLATKRAGWGKPLPEGHFHGVAVHKSFGSIVAEVAEVSLPTPDTLKLHKVTCVVDCGVAVNRDTIDAQMESGIVYALTAAAFGKIDIEDGAAVQGNFDSYEMLKLSQMPEIDVHIIEGGRPIGGIGEPGTPPLAPALVNAIHAASGKRIRSLPLTDHGLTLV